MKTGETNTKFVKHCYVYLAFFSITLCCCTSKTNKTCTPDYDMELLQQHEDAGITFRLYKNDDGAFGSTVTLRICDKTQDKLIEEIDLRGEDYLPTLDSVVDRTIYLHYNFPRTNTQIEREDLAFDSVVLGEALLEKTTLIYQYVFKNIANE